MLRLLTSMLVLSVLVGHVACGGEGGGDSADAAIDADAAVGDVEADVDAGDDAAADAVQDPSTDVPTDPEADAAGDADSDVDEDTDAADDDATDGATDTFVDADAETLDVVSEPDADLVEGGTLAPTATCTPAADACAELHAVTGVWASYRKDAYFTDEEYPEYTDPPVDGGRFHIAAIATGSGRVTDVLIDGESVQGRLAPPDPSIEWYHVWPEVAVEGEPIWVSFHSRDPAWDTSTEAALVLRTEDGTAFDDNFPVQQTPAPLTWVTTTDDRNTLLVHVQNLGGEAQTIDRVLVNGRDVTGGGTMCLTNDVIEPGQSRLLTLPLCEPLPLGSPWTVVVEYDDAPAAVGVGRVLRPHYVVEAWPTSSDCPVPTEEGSTEGYDRHREAGFDTMYLYWGGGPPRCPTSTADVVNRLAPRDGEMFTLIGDDFLNFENPETLITDTSMVAGFLTGDESDGEIYDEDGSPRPENKAEDARRLWSMYPEVTVYNGAKTNGHVGTFAGMVDVQGVDLYIAACAPHITEFGSHPGIRAAHDYLLNTRNNHMPGPTWLYAQGLHSGWNWGSDEDPIAAQPDRHEILIQAFSVLTAGGKGIMWFQTTQEEAERAPERWDAIATANWMIRSVRRLLREGDITGGATTSGEALVEAVRGTDAIVVPVVNLEVTEPVTDERCLLSRLDLEPPHWGIGDQRLRVRVDVPDELGVVDVFEVTAELEVVDANYAIDPDSRQVVLPAVDVSQEVPVRLFVVASEPGVRAEVETNLSEG